MQFSTPQQNKISVQITPLIDLMFIIIIFLLVSTTFIEQSAVKIDLPHGKQTTSMNQKSIEIIIDQNKIIYFEGNPIDLKTLEAQLLLTRKEHKEELVTLKADRNSPYGLAIEVIDLIKSSGFKKVIAITEHKSNE